MDNCVNCGAPNSLIHKKINYFINTTPHLLVSDVPVYECQLCGEQLVSSTTAEIIFSIRNVDVEKKLMEIQTHAFDDVKKAIGRIIHCAVTEEIYASVCGIDNRVTNHLYSMWQEKHFREGMEMLDYRLCSTCAILIKHGYGQTLDQIKEEFKEDVSDIRSGNTV